MCVWVLRMFVKVSNMIQHCSLLIVAKQRDIRWATRLPNNRPYHKIAFGVLVFVMMCFHWVLCVGICLLCMPLQHYLNKAFAAEAETHKFAELVSQAPTDTCMGPAEPPEKCNSEICVDVTSKKQSTKGKSFLTNVTPYLSGLMCRSNVLEVS